MLHTCSDLTQPFVPRWFFIPFHHRPAASEINTSWLQSRSHQFNSANNCSHLDNYTNVVCYYLNESMLSYVGQNKQNNKEGAKSCSRFVLCTKLGILVFCAFYSFINDSKVTSRVSLLKGDSERERGR